MLLHNEELSKSHYSHPQAFHLATSDQPLWSHQPLLRQRSFQRVAHRFLGMRNDWMQIKTKPFDFSKTHFHETYFDCVWNFVQMENKLFWLEMSWPNTILQEFWNGNVVLIKQKWSALKWAVFKVNCEPFHKCEFFVSTILLLSMLNSKMKK